MYLSEESDLYKKWQKVIDHDDLPKIKDNWKKAVTTVVLENAEKEFGTASSGGYLTEAPANQSGAFPDAANLKGYSPILISLIRRSMPNLIAFEIAGVQPMNGPVGLIFALRAKYNGQGGAEALHNEANTEFSSDATPPQAGDSPAQLTALGTEYTAGQGLTTLEGESLGDGTAPEFAEMAFSIDKVTVTAKTRALKAEYTVELAQDIKAIHNLDAETELVNILSAELVSEINREVVRTVNNNAVNGAQQADLSTPGTFDLDTDSDGRWNVERYKGLMFQIEREANQIARETRRGRGNIVVCDSDVASALSMAGLLDSAPALKDNLSHDGDTGNTFVGVLNGRFRVYVDPYVNITNGHYCTVGYRGASPFDAGIFYCPYVPLTMARAQGENSFQPKIAFKTRYGLVANPFSNITGDSDGSLAYNTNIYYRRVNIANLL